MAAKDDRLASIVDSNIDIPFIDEQYYSEWLRLYQQIQREFAWTIDDSES